MSKSQRLSEGQEDQRTKKSKSGRNARLRGASYEREVAAELSDWLGVDCKRKLGAARDGGDDIQVGQFRIECKRHETTKVWEWYAQAKANAAAGEEIPVVVFRRSRSESMALMSFTDFMRLMREFI